MSDKRIQIIFGARICEKGFTLSPQDRFDKYWQFHANGEKITTLTFKKITNPNGGNPQLRSTILVDCPPNINCGSKKPKGYVFLVNHSGGSSFGWHIKWQPYKEGSSGTVDVYKAHMIGRPYAGEGCRLKRTSNWLWTQDDVPYGFPIGNTEDTHLEWCHEWAAVGRTEVDIRLID